jgi:hypothetical protein
VCEYTYKVELIEVNKISLVVFNTTTGIKYQRYIEEYSELWEDLKLNFQHNFSLCFKMLTKALLDKDQGFNVSILHNIDFVVLQLSYINDLLGFTIDINVNQYKKDNLQESVNVMEYKQKLLEDENKSLKIEIKHIHEEVTELKRIINLLGDGFSYDNTLYEPSEEFYKCRTTDIFPKSNKLVYAFQWGRGVNQYNNRLQAPSAYNQSGEFVHPFINVVVANKLSTKLFHSIINKNKLNYDINIHGYNWEKLENMMKENGVTYCFRLYWQEIFTSPEPQYTINHFTYDFTWKSFKELFDITI